MVTNQTPSRYNVVFNTEDGGAILFNTFTGSVVKIDENETEIVGNILNNPSQADPQYADILSQNGFLIDNDRNQVQEVCNLRNRSIDQKKKFDLIILPTLACNFSCRYCYESRNSLDMSIEDCERILKFIRKEVSDYDTCSICWFGGEPLLNLSIIEKMCSSINAMRGEIRCKFNMHMTTNGYLLDPVTADLLVSLGVTDYMITVDGCRESHNQLRPLSNGEPTFDHIISNIKHILRYDDVIVTLRVNFNATNAMSLKSLLDEFQERYRKRITLLVEPIFGNTEYSAIGSMSNMEIVSYMSSMYDLAESMGYRFSSADISIMPRRYAYCYAEKKGQIIITPGCKIYKCPVQKYLPADAMGILSEDGLRVVNEKYNNWMKLGEGFSKLCKICQYLPICMGACRSNVQVELCKGKGTCAQMDVHRKRILDKIYKMGLLTKN